MIMKCVTLLSLAIHQPVTIRPAAVDDVKSIARVLIDTRRASNRDQLPKAYLAGLSYEKAENEYRQAVTQPEPNQITLVAQLENGAVTGFVNGKPTPDAPGANSVEMKELYIEESSQRKGIGEALITHFMAVALRNNVQQVHVWVLSSNHGARRFYEKFGAVHVRDAERLIGGETCALSVYVWNEEAMRTIAGGDLEQK